ncbi:MAG: hypothetical protein JXA52_05475 [Planctomycetes bacterium]|nr:hypothetical protein [Planctomycetota bacterium]
MERSMPKLLWVTLIALFCIALIQTRVFIELKAPVKLLLNILINAAFIIGLAKGQKWAYVLTCFFVLLSIILAFANSVAALAGSLFLTCIVVIPMLFCTDYFFPRLGSSESLWQKKNPG